MINKQKEFSGLQITFNTNEDCNLNCSYCYEINKKKKILSIDHAKKFIDLMLEDPDPLNIKGSANDWILNSGAILDFIGGDALMHPDLIEKIIKYWIYKSTIMKHKWAYNWRASISTNGTLFEREDVRKFIKKYRNVLSIGVSIDGCPEIHDKNRVFNDGKPSMPAILKWWPWFVSTFGDNALSTKSTLSKESIPYMYDSLVYMREELGLKWISQNFIFEDMNLEESDLIELDSQMEKCFNYVKQHDDFWWSLLDDRYSDSKPYADDKTSWCGSGFMPSLSTDGKIYPCFRWLPHTQKNDNYNMVIGDVEKGLYNKDIFELIRQQDRTKISPDKCKSCDIETGCAWCIAGCYSEFGEFKRQTYICEAQKIITKWAKMYKEDKNDNKINR